MRWIAAGVMVAVAAAGQAQSPTAAPDSSTWGKQVTAYTASSGVVAPELIPLAVNIPYQKKCDGKESGTVMIDIIVDASGAVRNAMFEKPLGNALDRLALQFIDVDRFKPGMLDGKPVAVAELAKVKLAGCEVTQDDSTGKKVRAISLREMPEQQFLPTIGDANRVRLATRFSTQALISGSVPLVSTGHGVTPPKLLKSINAQFSPEARRLHIGGSCLFTLIVDTEGMPQAIEELRSLGYGLDEEATRAVSTYRFRPAMRDGEPVPVRLTVEASFKYF